MSSIDKTRQEKGDQDMSQDNLGVKAFVTPRGVEVRAGVKQADGTTREVEVERIGSFREHVEAWLRLWKDYREGEEGAEDDDIAYEFAEEAWSSCYQDQEGEPSEVDFKALDDLTAAMRVSSL